MLPNLKLLRQEKGVSQQRLAEAIGVSQPSINKYENHSIEPELEILKRMADYFDTSVDYLIGHTNIRRRIEYTEPFSLNEEEMTVVRGYRSLKVSEKQCINQMIHVLAEKE